MKLLLLLITTAVNLIIVKSQSVDTNRVEGSDINELYNSFISTVELNDITHQKYQLYKDAGNFDFNTFQREDFLDIDKNKNYFRVFYNNNKIVKQFCPKYF